MKRIYAIAYENLLFVGENAKEELVDFMKSRNLLNVKDITHEVKTAADAMIEEEQAQKELEQTKEVHLIAESDLSTRTQHILQRAGYKALEELLTKSDKELMEIRNFGRKGFDELKAKLEELRAKKEEIQYWGN